LVELLITRNRGKKNFLIPEKLKKIPEGEKELLDVLIELNGTRRAICKENWTGRRGEKSKKSRWPWVPSAHSIHHQGRKVRSVEKGLSPNLEERPDLAFGVKERIV